MKKYYNLALCYTVLAIIGGVFYREFTKFNGFSGTTTLSLVHTHAFMLGMFFFLIVLLLEKQFSLSAHKNINKFLYIYNTGLLLSITMLWIRGILQVLGSELSSGINASISGISGIGHIVLGIGFIYFWTILKQQMNKNLHD